MAMNKPRRFMLLAIVVLALGCYHSGKDERQLCQSPEA
jgi:hypothetical protein